MKSKPKKYIIPNVFTALNVFCGFLAILYASKIPNNEQVIDPDFATVAWLIILASIFDMLDGKIARMTKAYSEFGIEFDSLADVVSFGVAPSVLLYQLYFFRFDTFGVVLSFLPLLFGSIRLARFNVQTSGFEKHGFIGLPIPLAAAGICTFVLFGLNKIINVADPIESLLKPFLVPLVLIICLLMVSTLPYDTLPKFSLKKGLANNVKLAYLIGGTILLISPYREFIFFPLVMTFVLSGIIRWVISMFKGTSENNDVPAEVKL